jgi:tetratricopeptide (TPR) repeat protein
VDCALRYAGFRQAFTTLFGAPGRELPPSTLLLFYRAEPFRALMPEDRRKDFKMVNLSFDVDGQSLTTFALSGDRDRALRMTFEFETIAALRRTGHFVPQWISQGAGGVLATTNVQAGKGRIVLGEPGDRSFSQTYAWPKFFAISKQSPEYKDPTKLSDYLDQAWGLMHWVLLSDDNSLARFDALEQRLRGEDGVAAVATVMKTPGAELTRAVRHQAGKRRDLPFDAAALQARFHISRAPEAEVLVQSAEVLLACRRDADAAAKLTQAVALAPELPAVKEARARQLLREGRTHAAVDLYREAIAAGSGNFSSYLHSAAQRLDDSSSGGRDAAGEGGAEAVTAVTEIRQAIQLNPGNLEAYLLLGRALFVLPNLTAAQIDELTPGVVPGPEGQPVRLYRAMLYDRLHERDACAKEFRALLADSGLSDDLRRIALRQYAGAMERLDGRRIEQLAEAKDYAGAWAVISAGEADPEPAVAAVYPRFRKWLQEKIRANPDATPEQRKQAGLE